MIGEWRQVENVVTILRGPGGGLLMVADPAQPSLELVRLRAAGCWRAQRASSGEGVYELSLDARDTMEVRKGHRALKIFRIARTRTLVGDWAHLTGKTISVAEAGAGLELRTEGKKPLRLLRRKIMEWEAQRGRGCSGEPVYALEHTEGSERIVVRRPEGLEDPRAPPLEFARAGCRGTSSSSGSRPLPLPPAPHDCREVPRPLPQGGGGGSKLVDRGSGRLGRSPPRRRPSPDDGRSPHEANLREFCTQNELSDRVVAALRSIGRREQRHIMGLDGSRNSFILTGNVRDPNAVVLSRLKRLKQAPLDSSGRSGVPTPGGGCASASRSRSAWRACSRSSSSASSSRSWSRRR